jgi:hypothetical protein
VVSRCPAVLRVIDRTQASSALENRVSSSLFISRPRPCIQCSLALLARSNSLWGVSALLRTDSGDLQRQLLIFARSAAKASFWREVGFWIFPHGNREGKLRCSLLIINFTVLDLKVGPHDCRMEDEPGSGKAHQGYGIYRSFLRTRSGGRGEK